MNLGLRIIKRLRTESKLYLPIRPPKKTSDIIVSLTSYSPRLKNLHLVIRSLLHQTLAPKQILLYLGTDTRESDIPATLMKLQKYNFRIKTGYEDLKPHKKYFYAMQEYPNDIIITVDDDLLYDSKLIEDLYKSYQRYPQCISARRVHKMTKKDNNKIESYNNWQWECTEITTPSYQLITTGCGGVLYPPKLLPQETFDKTAIQKYCLNTDDIWLKFMELKNNVKVVFTNSAVIHPLTIRKSQNTALMNINTQHETWNDINIQQMQNFTGINLADFVD